VIAAGGMMTGGDIASALKAGAEAAILGTAFLLCPEAGTSRPYRQALRNAMDDGKTRLTRVYSGRLARGIVNRFIEEMDETAVLPFPVQNAFTRDIRNQAVKAGSGAYLSLWAGLGVGRIREMGAGELVRVLLKEMADVM
jgi:nitronate monooxygenase